MSNKYLIDLTIGKMILLTPENDEKSNSKFIEYPQNHRQCLRQFCPEMSVGNYIVIAAV